MPKGSRTSISGGVVPVSKAVPHGYILRLILWLSRLVVAFLVPVPINLVELKATVLKPVLPEPKLGWVSDSDLVISSSALAMVTLGN